MIYVYYSTDRGATFTWQNTITPASTQGGFNLCIAVKQDDPATVCIGHCDLSTSTNSGVSFGGIIPDPLNYVHPDFHSIMFNPYNPLQFFAACDGGVYMHEGSAWWGSNSAWYDLNNNQLTLCEVYRIQASSDSIYAGLEDNTFGARGDGTTWCSFATSGDGTGVAALPWSDTTLFVTGNDGTIHRYYDGSYSSSWTNADLQTYWGNTFDWIGAIAADPYGIGAFYTARKLNDNGPVQYMVLPNGTTNTWTRLGTFGDGDPTPPQNIAISKSNPQIVYVSTSGNWSFARAIWKSIDAGMHWTSIIPTNSNVIPNLYITRLVTFPSDNPANEDEVYATLSGFFVNNNQGGHIFKSTDGGNSWSDISGNLPNAPVNDLVIRYVDSNNSKQLIAATDVGVYSSADNGNSWQELAQGLPLTVVTDLQYSKYENKIRASTFGRSVWEADLGGSIYITTADTIKNNINLDADLIVCSGASLVISNSCIINVAPNHKITIQDGASFITANGCNVTFFSSALWGGIEVDGNATLNLQNCTFGYCYNAITVNGSSSSSSIPSINIQGCYFASCSIVSTGCDNVAITRCTFYGASSQTATAISVIYGNNIVIAKNTINDVSNAVAIGISVSNSSPVVIYNTIDITFGTSQNAVAGIDMNNSYSSTVSHNTITGFIDGIYLFYSSPTMLSNNAVNINTATGGDTTTPCALYATYLSSPMLAPSSGDISGTTTWDAGLNILRSDNIGVAVYILNGSIPIVDQGYNTFNGYQYQFEGRIGTLLPYSYYATDNCWITTPPVMNVPDAIFYTEPENCSPPGGGGDPGVDVDPNSASEIENPNSEVVAPPPPIIIDYGHGICDTIKVLNHQLNVPANYVLYSQAVSNERSSQYQQAINIYQQIIQNYPDSSMTVTALKKLLYCNDKLNVNQNVYAQLRAYYQALAQNHSSDTALVKTANEMASKCLVRQQSYSQAITEYENVIGASHDSLQILCSQLNVVETYMIMQGGGNGNNPYNGNGNHNKGNKTNGNNQTTNIKGQVPNLNSKNSRNVMNSQNSFTGKYSKLKPKSQQEGIQKINELLHHLKLIASKPKSVPTVFSLSQNYPNPFNPVTKIDFEVPQTSKVTLKVYDILGRLVKTLVDENREAGYYTVSFDGTNLASGVYFYRIEVRQGESSTGKFVSSKKMVLLK